MELRRALRTTHPFQTNSQTSPHALTSRNIITSLTLRRRRVTTILQRNRNILHHFNRRRVGLTRTGRLIARHRTRLRLRHSTAIHSLGLRLVTRNTRRFTTTGHINRMVITTIFNIRRRRHTTVIRHIRLTLVRQHNLVRTVTVTLRRFLGTHTQRTARLVLYTRLRNRRNTILQGIKSRQFYRNFQHNVSNCITRVNRQVFIIVIFGNTSRLAQDELRTDGQFNFIGTQVTRIACFRN